MKADAVRSKVHGTNLAPKDDLKSLSLPEVEKKLDSSPDGLSQAEAVKRLTQYGPNEIAEKKTNAVLKFLSYEPFAEFPALSYSRTTYTYGMALLYR
jgi:H+-transporting ATPase